MKRLSIAVLLAALAVAVPFAQSAPAPGPSAAAPNLIGEWDLTTLSPVGENSNVVEFRKDGDTLKAVAKGERGERPYDGVKLEGDKLTLVITVDYEGQAMVITYFGTVSDKAINGSADFGGLAMGSFTAARKEAAKP